MRIQHNIMAMNSYRNFTNNTKAVSKNLEKLSSGYRINNAGDDAAGLAVSEKMRAQITGLKSAQKNAKDGISLVKTAEGALTEVHSMLNRMVDLATQSANGTFDNEVDRNNLQKEVTALKSEIDRIADSSNFNGIKLLDGTQGPSGKVTTAGVAGTGDGVTAGAAGTATVYSLDFSKTEISAGKSIKIGDTTYEFVKSGGTAQAGNTAVTLGANKDASLTALATAIGTADDFFGAGNDATVAASGGKLTFTSATPAAGDTSGNLGEAAFEADPTQIDVSKMGLTLQIGDTADGFNKMQVGIGDMHADALGIGDIDISTQDGASDAIASIKSAINSVSGTRGDLGALQNRLDHTINNLSVMHENIQDAEATIRDTDVADEMMAYTKNNILVQSAQAMLAQANQVPQGVLQLLG